MKALQKFSDEYLERCKELTVEEKFDFIENFRLMHSEIHSPSKLISLKVQESLLNSFKQKAKLEGVAYQTKIKELMKDWVNNDL